MPRIQQLPLHEAQKIAAGEVVDRPANVVKELIENALDAGATQITLHIIDGGKEKIRVVDNGCGMSPEDARLCFLQHATSKITSVDQLSSLTTFGFRGEALASISAVSKVTLITSEGGIEGTQLELEAGTILSEFPVPSTQGTDITVENLFFNVPARRKFLKSKDTEWRQVVTLFHAFALDYKHIHFKMFSEGTELYNCAPVNDIADRFAQLWDSHLFQHLVRVEQENSSYAVSVHGVISNHQYFRYDRSCMFFFVNKRWVKNSALSKAAMKGYLNVIPADRFPAVCLFVTVNPEHVDINIHPRKEEVQFLNPRVVENLVTTAIKAALENHLSAQLGKKISFSDHKEHNTPLPLPFASSPRMPISVPPRILFTDVGNTGSTAVHNTMSHVTPSNHQLATEISYHEKQNPIETVMPVFSILGQYNKTYILIEQEDGLFLVDQHAAHERILYEQFASRFEHKQPVALLFAYTVFVSTDDIRLLEAHYYLFKDNGIIWEQTGPTQIAITAVPVFAKEIPFAEIINQALGWIKEYKSIEPDQFQKLLQEKLRAQMACKAAVKAGDILSLAQMEQLLADLAKTPQRFTCPHGRPTGWLLSLNEIERKFKRKL